MDTSKIEKTIAASPLDTGLIAQRVATSARLRSGLSEVPNGPTLIYEAPGSREVCSLSLDKDETIVGRSPLTSNDPHGSHLAFPGSQKLSSRHFAIRRKGEEFLLVDLGSTNGTYVNSNPVPSKTKVLAEADLIIAGGIVFAYVEA